MAKQKATAERRQKREDFVFKYKLLMTDLIGAGTDEMIHAFVQIARKELGYSPKTATCDIWTYLKRTFVKMK